MFFDSTNENIRYTGRFGTSNSWATPHCMTASATGAYFEFSFMGSSAEMEFDVSLSYSPRGHVYIEVDGAARVESTIEKYIRITAKGDGPHHVRVIYKSSVEQMNRWIQPLNSKIAFMGVEAENLVPLAPDNRETIEFIGDSITEGVLVAEKDVSNIDQLNRPWQDDSTSTYAWQFAEMMNFRPYIMGYGSEGLTRMGCGCVPKAAEAYPYNFEDSEVTYKSCDYIMVNHGANDRGPNNTPNDRYYDEYKNFLKLLRERNPHSKIIVLTPFCGAMEDTLPEFVRSYNEAEKESIYLISSKGWVPYEPLHPLRDGHRLIAEKLAEEFKKLGI